MIESLIQFLEVQVIPFGVPGVVVAAFIEELVAPLPSPVVMTISGFFFLDGDFSITLLWQALVLVGLPYAVGMLTASFLLYFLASALGKPFIERWGWILKISWSDVEKLNTRLQNTSLDLWTLFTLRIIPLVPSVAIALFCGAIKMNPISYGIVTFCGVTIRAVLFSLLGWYAGMQYLEYAEWIANYETVLIAIGLVVVAVAFLIFYRRRGAAGRQHPAS